MILAGWSLAVGGLSFACASSPEPCEGCIDPNVADFRLSVTGDFCLDAEGAEISGFMATNWSSFPSADRALADSDADGLSDAEELRLGTDPSSADTDGDGFSDLVESRMRARGYDPLTPGTPCGATADSDGDGLLDCEESALGSQPRSIDSDADGLPDPVELRFGTELMRPDAQADADLDAVENGREILANTNPLVNDALRNASDAYSYSLLINNPGTPTRCVSFEVGNVELKVTELDGWNQILLYRRSTLPDGNAIHRFACARARFPGTLMSTEPRNGELSIPMSAWQADDSAAKSHCVCPSGRVGTCSAP